MNAQDTSSTDSTDDGSTTAADAVEIETEGPPDNMVCNNDSNDKYAVQEEVSICLFFDDKVNPIQKVVYKVVID